MVQAYLSKQASTLPLDWMGITSTKSLQSNLKITHLVQFRIKHETYIGGGREPYNADNTARLFLQGTGAILAGCSSCHYQ